MKNIQLPKPNKFLIWISISFFVKVTFLLLKIIRTDFGNAYYKTYGYLAGDTKSYIEPIENLLANGEYFDDYRMPGYGWVYFVFRLFANQPYSLNLLLLAQVTLTAISVYALALIALKIFKKTAYFYCTYIVFLVSTFSSSYDAFLLTESFCTSALIFSLYFLLQGGYKNLFFSGLFITWAIFLRPVFVPILIIFLLYLLLDLFLKSELKFNRKLFFSIFFICIPFVLIDGAWVLRNYLKYEKIIMLQKFYTYSWIDETYHRSLFNFVQSFGGSFIYWESGSEILFFKEPSVVNSKNIIKPRQIPNYIYTSKFNLDSLYLIKNQIAIIDSDSGNTPEKKKIEEDVIRKLNIYSQSIRDEKPVLYYLTSRFQVCKTFFLHSGTQNLFQKSFNDLNNFQRFIKVFYFLLYICTSLIGLLTLIFLFFTCFRNPQILLISSFGLYSSLIYPLVLKLDEQRYFVTAYPIYTLAFVFALVTIYHKIFKTR